MLHRLAAASCVALLLAGCAADSVQVTVGAKDIAAAISGDEVTVPFIAIFDTFGDLDDEKRSELEAIEAIARRYLQIDEFEVEQAESSLKVTVEGEIPLVYGPTTSVQSPWVIKIEDIKGQGLDEVATQSVQFVTGGTFERFSGEAKGISYMATPDQVQPVRFRIRANNGQALRLLAGGFQEGASSHMISVVDVPPGDSKSLLFSAGAYSSVGGGFWILR